jgi:predicted ATPase
VIRGIRVFSFDATALAAPVELKREMELARNGAGLAGVLDRLRDHNEGRFEALNDEFSRWLPEFDRITFDLDTNNRRVFLLRIRDGGHEVPATDVSQGTLIALAILTLAYLPEPPSILGLEEPDRGIHPRLLRHVKDALHRLSHPESCGETREPVQVIATTHSPYFLDLFRPEEIVIANRVGQEVKFERLSDQPNIEEIVGEAPLGEAWYTGILGGVPFEP